MKRLLPFGLVCALFLWGGIGLPARAADAPAPPSPPVDVAADAGLPADTLALLRRLPENARFVVTIDLGDDNPSMRYARRPVFTAVNESERNARRILPGDYGPGGLGGPDRYESIGAAQGDVREGVSRILRLFGLNSGVFDRLSASIGPRFVLAAVPGTKKNGLPDLLVLAAVSDRGKAESSLSALIGSLARNAEETTEPLSGGDLHSWTGFPFMKTLKLSYLLGSDVAAIGTNLSLLQSASAGREAAPAWISSLAPASPRGLVNVFVSPHIPELFGVSSTDMDPTQLGFAGATASLTLHEDGILLTESALLAKDGMLSSALAGASNLPALSDAAFQRIPGDSLLVLAASSPAAWLKSFGGAGLLASMGTGPNSPGAMMMGMLTSVFDGDTTVTLRSALPLPSVVAMVVGSDSASASKKVDSILSVARQMKLPATEIGLAGGGRATAIKVGMDPFENVIVAQQGSCGVVSTDRRTMEEVAGLDEGDSLAESDEFRAVRGHVGAGANVLLYADLSPLSGLGMIASEAMYMGLPIGRTLAQIFSKVRGMGVGVSITPDRITSRTFVSCEPAVALPAMMGMAAGAAGGAIAFLAQSHLRHPQLVRPPSRVPAVRRPPAPKARPAHPMQRHAVTSGTPHRRPATTSRKETQHPR